MPVENSTKLTCDRCDVSQQVETEFEDTASAVIEANAQGKLGWKRRWVLAVF